MLGLRRVEITDWRPEDERFWVQTGRRVAWRNLVFSVFTEHLGFAVWLLWSVVVVSLTPAAGFHLTMGQKFWLVAVPNLVGAALRLPYTVAVARFGGRNWTIISAVLLLIPLGLLSYCVLHPGLPFPVILACAATAGFGGGNFASSMANISYFFPDGRKGLALGLNAAGGNLGVAVVQLVVPIAIGLGVAGAGRPQLAIAALLWVPLVLLAAACSAAFMDNLATARASLRQLLQPVRNRHTWVMCVLYIGTFGSFIGYSAAFGLLTKIQHPEVTVTHYAFLGPLVGSLSRPLGGYLADRLGGARVTAWVFLAMGGAVLWLMATLDAGGFGAFLAAFMVLFVLAGLGNGSTYRMIPAIFAAQPPRRGQNPASAALAARRQAAAVIGLAGAVGAVGGFLIPIGFSASLSANGSVDAALLAFLGFYGVCLTVTWWCYLRRSVLVGWAPSLAHATV
jgi:NNP family nitrate/nitrite transporter-like MFS transporter